MNGNSSKVCGDLCILRKFCDIRISPEELYANMRVISSSFEL